MSTSPRKVGFFCRTCRRYHEDATRVPTGWYVVARKASNGMVRLGVFCSAECMTKGMTFIRYREQKKGHEWEDVAPISGDTRLFGGPRRHAAESRESIEKLMKQARS